MESKIEVVNTVEDALAFLHFERGAVVVTLPSGQFYVFTFSGELEGTYTPEELLAMAREEAGYPAPFP